MKKALRTPCQTRKREISTLPEISDCHGFPIGHTTSSRLHTGRVDLTYLPGTILLLLLPLWFLLFFHSWLFLKWQRWSWSPQGTYPSLGRHCKISPPSLGVPLLLRPFYYAFFDALRPPGVITVRDLTPPPLPLWLWGWIVWFPRSPRRYGSRVPRRQSVFSSPFLTGSCPCFADPFSFWSRFDGCASPLFVSSPCFEIWEICALPFFGFFSLLTASSCYLLLEADFLALWGPPHLGSRGFLSLRRALFFVKAEASDPGSRRAGGWGGAFFGVRLSLLSAFVSTGLVGWEGWGSSRFPGSAGGAAGTGGCWAPPNRWSSSRSSASTQRSFAAANSWNPASSPRSNSRGNCRQTRGLPLVTPPEARATEVKPGFSCL